MAAKIDKVILTNIDVLKLKYGEQGLTAIRGAVAKLIASDEKRGLRTRLIGVDDIERMRSLSAKPVRKPDSFQQNKTAFDQIYRALTPDYMMILGSHDVIPHQDVLNPLYRKPRGGEPDKFAWGDLPYACDAPYGQSINEFLGPTRVVGRLPDITGGDDHRYLVGLLATAARYVARDPEDFQDHFALTAQVWEASTALSVQRIFHNDRNLQKVPPRGYRWVPSLISRRIHFFNCHGSARSSKFYGQPINRTASYPTALSAQYMDGKVREGTVAAAECCFGGELYALS